jgi:tetratricopeptide (TPR) repeat protein
VALRWAIASDEAERAQEAAGALWRFWQQRGHLAEGRGWLEEALAMPSGAEPTAARAKALIGAGGVAWWRQDRDAAGAFYQEAVSIERQLGDPVRTAGALYNLSFFVAGDDLDAANRLLDEALDLFRKGGDEQGVAQVLSLMVMADAEQGRWEPVIASLEEVVAIWRRLGDRLHLAFDLVWLGYARGKAGRHAEAAAAGLEAVDLFRAAENHTGLGIALLDMAFLATWSGRHEDAIRLAGANESLRQRVGGPPAAIGGLMAGDPAAEARAHVPEGVAQRAWEDGLAMGVDDAVALARREGAGPDQPGVTG